MTETFFGNSLSAWTQALVAFVLTAFVLGLIVMFSRNQVKKQEKALILFRILSRVNWATLIAVALWAAAHFLTLPAELLQFLRVIFSSILALQVGFCVEELIKMVADKELDKVPEDELTKRSSIRGIAMGVRVLLWMILIIFVLESIPNLSIVNIITSLGLGGIAIGLAAQSFVGDLLSSLTIRLDKPFDVGDSITIGEFSGTVQKIGVKSTTLRNVSGEDLVISNSNLLANPLQNFSRMEERFHILSLPLALDTPVEKLDGLAAEIEETLNKIENVRFGRARFKSITPTSLEVEVAYTVTDPQFSVFVKVSHAVNLALLNLLQQNGIQPGSPLLNLTGLNQ